MSTINLGEHQGDGIRYSMHISAPAGGLGQMIRNPAGNWVGYAEYAALQAENERLRKAGDAVIEKLAEAYAGDVSEFDHAHVFKAWIEAKETRP